MRTADAPMESELPLYFWLEHPAFKWNHLKADKML